LTKEKSCDITKTNMSKRRLGNLLKRRIVSSLRKLVFLKDLPTDEWARKQFNDLSRFGSNFVVMKMGN